MRSTPHMFKVNTAALLLFFLTTINTYATDLEVRHRILNPSKDINNAQIVLDVDGGEPPYTYYWSEQSTPLNSNRARRLVEGMTYHVTVTDATGESVSLSIKIPAESITEKFNGTFKPIVNAMASVLFWDVFSAIGIYDPVVYEKEKMLFAPHWDPETKQVFSVERYLVKDKSRVDSGQAVAVVSIGDEQLETVYAPAPGRFIHKIKEGGIIYNPDNPEHVIAQHAHHFADLKFDEPRALLHPNGDLVEKGIPFIVIWLVFGAAFFTLRMGFINVRGFKHSLDLVRGKYDDPDAPGRITHFQALSTAVSATVGLGNIAGVAIAISLGGAGATFWMIVAGLLGMSSKFVECTLGVKYRFIDKTGRIFGGPMNYLRYGLEKRNMSKLGKVLAGFFALLAIGG